MSRTGCWGAIALLLVATTSAAKAQSVTGQISGTVTDSGGDVISGASVELSNDLTRQVRAFTTESNGRFIFIDLVPGDYSIHITYPGFRAHDQSAINVSAQEKVALHDIRLQLGDVNSTVVVRAEVAHVATDSSDRSILVNSVQIENTPIRGRDWLGVMHALPGVVDLNSHDTPGWNSGMPTINGGQAGQVAITMDGVVSQDSGAPQNNGYLAPNTANLIRPFAGYGAINTTCSCGEAYYNSLQTQLNRRFGRRLQFGANWTWSKTLTYTRGPWTPDYLSYNEVSTSRPQVVNLSYSYRIPDGSRVWRNALTRTALDGWHFNGITKMLSGNPLTVVCTAQTAPIGYWTGTTTTGIPFRCQMVGGDVFLPAGRALPATAPRGRYYPLNAANFKLPGANSLGIGNTPPTLFYGPGFENFDFSLLKDIRLGREDRVLEFRAEAFNVLNHFNPGNPNTTLALNYTSGANTNANFGTITTAVGQARHMALALKFRFWADL